MTTYRSGFTLWQMVRTARDLTDDARVRERVDAVLGIMGGLGGTYGRGRPLVNALEDVAQEAILYGDFPLAQRFQRFAAYAGGELFLEILENHYDEEARQRSEEYMRRTVAMGADRAVAVLDVLCRDKSDATAADARDLFLGIAQSADYLGLGDGEGGIQLSTREAKRLPGLRIRLRGRGVTLPWSPAVPAQRGVQLEPLDCESAEQAP